MEALDWQTVLCTLEYVSADPISATDVVAQLRRCSLTSKLWLTSCQTETLWRALFLRTSPTPTTDCFPTHPGTPFNHPAARLPAQWDFDGCWRQLYHKRAQAAHRTSGAHREAVGFVQCVSCDGWNEVPKYICTTLSSGTSPRPRIKYENLHFIFELFELNHETNRRNNLLGDSSQSDFMSEAVLREHAGPPHFATRSDVDCTENLLWSTTVKADPELSTVTAQPLMHCEGLPNGCCAGSAPPCPQHQSDYPVQHCAN